MTTAIGFDLRTGASAIVKNGVTRQYFYLHISEILDRDGMFIITGEAGPHAIWLPAVHGVESVPARLSCIVLAPLESDAKIIRFRDAAGGIPWFAVEQPKALVGAPVMNMARLAGFGPAGIDRNALVGRAVRMILEYRVWRRTGHMSTEWREARAAARSGPSPTMLGKDGMWTPS